VSGVNPGDLEDPEAPAATGVIECEVEEGLEARLIAKGAGAADGTRVEGAAMVEEEDFCRVAAAVAVVKIPADSGETLAVETWVASDLASGAIQKYDKMLTFP